MTKPEPISVKINDKFVTQILNTPEITDVIKRYAKSEYEYSKHDHTDDETYAHLDVVFTFMFAELKPLVDEHINLNPGEWYYVDYLGCFGQLLSKYHEHICIANAVISELKKQMSDDFNDSTD